VPRGETPISRLVSFRRGGEAIPVRFLRERGLAAAATGRSEGASPSTYPARHPLLWTAQHHRRRAHHRTTPVTTAAPSLSCFRTGWRAAAPPRRPRRPPRHRRWRCGPDPPTPATGSPDPPAAAAPGRPIATGALGRARHSHRRRKPLAPLLLPLFCILFIA
jgi:hypothetical protein